MTRSLEGRIQADHRLFSALAADADDNAVRLQEIIDCVAFFQKLRV